VFVMEEEYRLHKTTASVDLNGDQSDTDNASTRAMISPNVPNTPSDIPTIRISSESSRHSNSNATETDAKPEGELALEPEPPAIEKPEIAQATTDPTSPMAMKGTSVDEDEVYEGSTFSNKRLCERWLGRSGIYIKY